MPEAARRKDLQPVALKEMADAIRFLSMDAVEKAASGHPGMPMGFADVATVLFTKFLKFDASNPKWPDRDRFVLSAGHGSMLLYSALYLCGYQDITIEDIKSFRQLGAKTAGHPEYGALAGIETTTGPLGQGFANAVGMALAEAMLADRFGDEVVNHRTFVAVSDGDMMEGISHEAASLAGHLGLKKLIALYDDNGISIDGRTDLSFSDDVLTRFKSYGWNTARVDGHNFEEIEKVIAGSLNSTKPTIISCKTVIGHGAPSKAGTEKCHGSPLGAAEIDGARLKLGWKHQPFEVPEHILAAWRETGAKGAVEHTAWQKQLNKLPKELSREFERIIHGNLAYGWPESIAEVKEKFAKDGKAVSTRKASGTVLDSVTTRLPEMIGGSADLTGSNNTIAKGMKAIASGDYKGSYIYYGVREHGMAAIMNGIALHGGFIPYSGTFLIFSDYMKPSIRLSALMKQRVIYVMTHDSIGLGEDGPTHQPIEQLAGLRAMPNLLVMRPADAVETAECWALALASKDSPSLLALTRQDLPIVRTEITEENLSARGGYILKEASAEHPKVTLIGTGSEVQIALAAREKLEAAGVPTRVVSMPSTTLFERQGEVYRRNTLGQGALKVVIEAASPFGWDRYFGKYGFFIGMRSFGESAPAPELYKHFGITAENVASSVLERLGI